MLKPYFGQCNVIRSKFIDGEYFWLVMMTNKEEITSQEFIKTVKVSDLIDDDETVEEYINSYSDIKFYSSKVDSTEVYFLSSSGFEFVFMDKEDQIKWGMYR